MAKQNYKKNTNYKGKSGKGSYKDNVKDAPKYDTVGESKINDITHHAKDAQLLSDAASFAYSNALGTLFNTSTTGEEYSSIPGVCAMVIHPMIGKATGWNDAINVASRSLYSWIRHANSGHANYEAADLMMYIYAMANLDSMLEWAKRLYGICGNVSFKNRYIPKALVEANGVNFENLSSHLADFRYALNMAIRKRNSLAVPRHMAVYERMRWMYSGLYQDANTPKSQIYMFVPEGWYFVNIGSGISDATHLLYLKISGDYGALPETLINWEDVIEYINSLINVLWGEEDFNIMSGDILKAYGAEGVEVVNEIADDFRTEIRYEFEVLSEIQNATVFRCNIENDQILQDPDINKGHIYYRPRFNYPDEKLAALYSGHKRMITLPYVTPTPADTMIATRLAFIPGILDTQGILDDDHHVGSEIVTGMRIAKVKYNESTQRPDLVWDTTLAAYTHPDVSQAYFPQFLESLTSISRFDYHPSISTSPHDGDKELSSTPSTVFDVDNYTLMTAADLNKMHDLSIWTQFDWGTK